MKILVTGSEGSLMQQVIPLLLAQGFEVVGVDNFARYGVIDRNRDYEFVQGDLTETDFVNNLVRGMDGVIQGAALIYGVGGFHRYPADILAKDVVLHQNILWAMLKNDVEKVAYISSSMVYERCASHPSNEDMVMESLIPLTDYGLSKLVGERLVQAFQLQYGLKYAIWRPFNIITPYEEGEQEQGMSHVFADFIRNLILEKKNPLPIIGNGEQVRCFTWIKDIAQAIAQYSFDAKTDNEDFNLGNQEPITMKELALLMYDAAQQRGLISADAGPLTFTTTREYDDDVITRIPGVEKAAAVLGWKAGVKVHESVGYCLDHIQNSN